MSIAIFFKKIAQIVSTEKLRKKTLVQKAVYKMWGNKHLDVAYAVPIAMR